MAQGNKMEDALLKRMQAEGMSKEKAIAAAKKQGLMKQEGKNLALTDKGKSSAKAAQRQLKASDKAGGSYSYQQKNQEWKKKKS